MMLRMIFFINRFNEARGYSGNHNIWCVRVITEIFE